MSSAEPEWMRQREGRSEITVSRDMLRAELAEMELRLRLFLAVELAKKTSVESFQGLQEAMAAFQRGEFTLAQRLAFKKIADESVAANITSTWSRNQRVLAWIGGACAVISIVLVAVYTAHALSTGRW